MFFLDFESLFIYFFFVCALTGTLGLDLMLVSIHSNYLKCVVGGQPEKDANPVIKQQNSSNALF